MLAGNVGIVLQAVDNARHASRQRRFGKGNAVAHGVAGANLHRHPRVPAQPLQFVDEGHHEAVEVRPGDVLQMAAGNDSGIEGFLHRGKVIVHGLFSRHLHFLEDVVVRAGDQNAGFLDAKVMHQLEVFLCRPNPAGDLREFEVQRHALFDGLPVFFAVDEKFRLADDAVGAAQLAQQLVDVHDLVNGIRLHGLLTIPQGGVRDPDLLRHGHGHPAVVERHLGNGAVGIHIPLQIRFRHILKGVFVGFLLQQVGLTGNL